MTVADKVRDIVLPALSTHEVELYDLEVSGSLVRVVVDRAGGVDLEALGAVTRAVSRALDEADPISHRYTLEVTSPGVERRLRRPHHFVRAVGEVVKVRTTPEVEGDRRVEGTLTSADDDGITVSVEASEAADADGPAEPAQRRLTYDQIERARTVFEWGTPSERPGRPAASPGSRKKRERRS